jgi:hypothetical protein
MPGSFAVSDNKFTPPIFSDLKLRKKNRFVRIVEGDVLPDIVEKWF